MNWRQVFVWAPVVLLAALGAGVGALKGGDYYIFDDAIRIAVADPGSVYAPLDQPFLFLYGPIFLVLAYPLSFFSVATAKGIWIAFQCVCYFGLVALLRRFFPSVARNPLLALWGFVFLINPVHSNFQVLNIQVPILAVLLLAQWLCESDTPRKHQIAGALCTVVTFIKAFPAFFVLLLFLTGKKGFRQGLVLGAVACFVLPALVFGFENGVALYKGFFENLTRIGKVDYVTAPTHVLNLHSLIAHIGHTFAWSAKTVSTVTSICWVSTACAFFAFTTWMSRTARWSDVTYQRGWYALGLALNVFLAPYTYIHYYVFYVPVFFWAMETLSASANARRLQITALAVVTALVALTTDFVVGRDLNSQLESYSVPLWGVILLMTLAAHRLFKSLVVRRL